MMKRYESGLFSCTIINLIVQLWLLTSQQAMLPNKVPMSYNIATGDQTNLVVTSNSITKLISYWSPLIVIALGELLLILSIVAYNNSQQTSRSLLTIRLHQKLSGQHYTLLVTIIVCSLVLYSWAGVFTILKQPAIRTLLNTGVNVLLGLLLLAIIYVITKVITHKK